MSSTNGCLKAWGFGCIRGGETTRALCFDYGSCERCANVCEAISVKGNEVVGNVGGDPCSYPGGDEYRFCYAIKGTLDIPGGVEEGGAGLPAFF